MSRPGLARGVRLTWDPNREAHALLYPEGVLLLDPVAADVVRACDGRRDPAAIVEVLARTYDGVSTEDVERLLADLAARRLLADGGAGVPERVADGPLGLLAELTYRCPLRCGYCSNPMNLHGYRDELTTAHWRDVFEQARAAGVLQVHLSGGEPLLRDDLPELVGQASRLGMYTNLVTSGIPLDAARLATLLAAGLEHLQLSIQDSDAAGADRVAGGRFHERKLAAAALIRDAGIPLTVNVVLHAGNVDRLAGIAELAVGLGADRLELAHTQYYGWGLHNRAALMPTRAQVDAAAEAAAAVEQRHGERVEIVYVRPDYHTGTVKPCMQGWGARQLVVAPNGDALPCLAAAQLPGLAVPSVRTEPLAAIWRDSAMFNAFRGTAWMREPCRSCALRDVDLGGCRCQALQLTGDAAATDPACRFSPHHDTVRAVVDSPERPDPVPRRAR